MTTTSAPSPERLLALIDAMAGRPVAMVVDLVADRFITGVPKRISREAPVLILSYQGERLAPGGGANAVANVAALGGRPLPVGVVGDDASGRRAGRGAGGAGGRDRRDPASGAGYRTPTKVRILGGGRHSIKQQIVRYDIEDTLALTDEERGRFCGFLTEQAGRAGEVRAAILSDYGYGAVEPALLAPVRDALGPRPAPWSATAATGWASSAASTAPPPTRRRPRRCSAARSATTPPRLAAAGRSLLDAAGRPLPAGHPGQPRHEPVRAAAAPTHLPVHGTDQVADVTGAGDTVIGTFALALAAGAAPLEAAAPRQLRRRRSGDEDGHRHPQSATSSAAPSRAIPGRSTSSTARADRRAHGTAPWARS